MHIESNITQHNKLNSTTISFPSGKMFFDDLRCSLVPYHGMAIYYPVRVTTYTTNDKRANIGSVSFLCGQN